MSVKRPRMMAGGGAHAVVGVARVLHNARSAASIACRLPRNIRRPNSRLEQEAGFTLVEVIVALAMLSVGLTMLLGLISSSLKQTASAERMAEASSLAQALMDEVGVDLTVNPEQRDGQFANGYRWHLKMLPYGDAKEREEWPVSVYTISTEVEWEDGTERRSYVLTTLRFGPRQVRQ
jgi:general secretion pathway protein I